MGMKYSDKKVDPVIVMKAYNANKSPKEAAKMFKNETQYGKKKGFQAAR